MQHEKMRRLVLAAMFAAITAVTAQLVIPLGFTPVPFTLARIAIVLTGAPVSYTHLDVYKRQVYDAWAFGPVCTA